MCGDDQTSELEKMSWCWWGLQWYMYVSSGTCYMLGFPYFSAVNLC